MVKIKGDSFLLLKHIPHLTTSFALVLLPYKIYESEFFNIYKYLNQIKNPQKVN